MKSEKEKMLAGEHYQALDPELAEERLNARKLFKRINSTGAEEEPLRLELFARLFQQELENLWIEAPFYCDYGYNINLGKNVFFNYNCVVLDVCQVEIGDNTMFGPAVQIYTATHPLDARERTSGVEMGQPVKIGHSVWVCGGAIINPGVTIGDRTVIGAGSVVTKDIPSDVFAAGNPCRIIRPL
jgi:maltose O-acetyltransferase